MSMIASHLTVGSLLSRALHIFPAFDGASGFVLLSGLVVGIVQSKRFGTSGLAAVEWKTVRRLGVIFVAQLSLVVLGVVVAMTAPHPGVPDLSDSSLADVIVGTVGFYLAPPPASVLRLYLVLLGLALGAYWLLSKGQWVVTLCASLALYALGWIVPDLTSFRRYDSDELGANWATWQLLFMIALVLGWKWRELRLAERLLNRSGWVLLVSGLCIVGAHFGENYFPGFFDKALFAPGRIIVAYAVVTFLFVIVSWLLTKIPKWIFRPVEMIGARSLDSYIIQAGVAIVLPAVYIYSGRSVIATVIAVATMLFCWAWAEFRRSSLWPARVIRERRNERLSS